ncbi:aftiphilin a isoform X1 [Colossoma macropomum]|uniref:aftiphilin a isoform X1 n=2 Tax=Colossoma macropomum TaxID=42526 RepID=UPI0018651643|nr:aftiphilin a isoform X1 [Colossoma macropomum]
MDDVHNVFRTAYSGKMSGVKSWLRDSAGSAMEPDVIRMYSSSPPPMEDGAEEEDDEFSDFTGVPNSVSFSEFDTPTTFNQLQALNATSPPELITNGRIVGLHGPTGPVKSNGGIPSSDQGGGPACRTVNVEELKKATERMHGAYTKHSDISANDWTASDAVDCNGGVGGVETLTNGFATFDTEGTPPSCHKHRETGNPSVDYCPDAVANDNDEDFADFSAFSHADVSGGGANWENSNHEDRLAEDTVKQDNDKDACVTGFASLAFTAEASDGLSNGDWSFHTGASFEQRDLETDNAHVIAVSTEQTLAQNGVAQNGLEGKGKVDNRVSPVSEDERGSSSEPTEEKGSGNDTETETETETSFGRPLSTDALEEFGDFSTTGSVPSPPLQEETATPADHSQLAEDDDEDFGDFGDFGDASSFGGAGFADFDQQGDIPSESVSQTNLEITCTDEDEFGDFDASKDPSSAGQENEDGTKFADFPGSDSFADFSSAPVESSADASSGWQAFNEPDSNREQGESWAAFGEDQGSAFSEKSSDDWHEGQSVQVPPSGSSEDSRKDSITVSLVSRLEKLFLVSFPEAPVPQVGKEVSPLKAFLEPSDRPEQEEGDTAPASRALQDVWRQLQDIHNAFGLRYQWGGSHSNKTLLCSLGIDTRNILFTGQKKQPVIVPMYAASLGMLEPTKEPVKPVSAAEMIASIAQSPSISTEMSTCPPDSLQETLPPVQFDWSSSGLTNPLDASGGSSLLNLDFFGPVDESPSSSATSIPGVDPELYELTQAKMEVSGGGSRVADAFARLMSTVEKTNTSTRRLQVRKEENLSEEARRVIAGLPDLSFMQAKVLMFPSTLTPLPLSSSSSPSPVPD